MNKHYSASYRLRANYLDDEELNVPAWAWLLAGVVILLVLVVR